MVFMIIIPMKNGYFIGNINPTFSDKPISVHHRRLQKKALRSLQSVVTDDVFAPREPTAATQWIGVFRAVLWRWESRPPRKPSWAASDAFVAQYLHLSNVQKFWLVVEPPEKYESHLGYVGIMKFPIYGKIKHVSNHQSDLKSADLNI